MMRFKVKGDEHPFNPTIERLKKDGLQLPQQYLTPNYHVF